MFKYHLNLFKDLCFQTYEKVDKSYWTRLHSASNVETKVFKKDSSAHLSLLGMIKKT